jgi:hypothetical protein
VMYTSVLSHVRPPSMPIKMIIPVSFLLISWLEYSREALKSRGKLDI